MGIPYSFNNEESNSDFSTLVVPISTGRPKVCISRHSSATDLHLHTDSYKLNQADPYDSLDDELVQL